MIVAVLYCERIPDESDRSYRNSSSSVSADVAEYVPLAFALFPTTFYFRMAYSESLFALEAITLLYGIRSRWDNVQNVAHNFLKAVSEQVEFCC